MLVKRYGLAGSVDIEQAFRGAAEVGDPLGLLTSGVHPCHVEQTIMEEAARYLVRAAEVGASYAWQDCTHTAETLEVESAGLEPWPMSLERRVLEPPPDSKIDRLPHAYFEIDRMKSSERPCFPRTSEPDLPRTLRHRQGVGMRQPPHGLARGSAVSAATARTSVPWGAGGWERPPRPHQRPPLRRRVLRGLRLRVGACLEEGGLREGGGGKVYLVGAGPGHRQYLTVRAAELLAQVADVVVYDDLSDDASAPGSSALGLARASAELRHVGKRGGDPLSVAQADIDALLVRLAGREGKQVVRLKGGDPFVFGRAATELAACRAAGIEVEVVPGISSCLAAPLLAGIPVTDAATASTFAVATGHAPDAIDWQGLRGADTLVVLMAAAALEDLCARLVADGGRDPGTPAAVVHAAGTDRQRVWRADLATLPAALGPEGAGRRLSPCVLVVGHAVAVADPALAIATAAAVARGSRPARTP